MILRDTWNPALNCDHCGLTFTEGSGAKALRDNAKARGWVERRRYGAVRDYCPTCAGSIAEREEARRRPKRRTR